jgi:hypothetical protein
VDFSELIRNALEQFAPDAPDLLRIRAQLDEDARASYPPRSMYERFITGWRQSQDQRAMAWHLLDKISLTLALDRSDACDVLIDALCPKMPADEWVTQNQWKRYIATLALAHSQTELLDRLKVRTDIPSCRDLVLHLLYEWSIQGKTIPTEDVSWVETIRHNSIDPLGRLPLTLLDIERLIRPARLSNTRGAVYLAIPALERPELNRVESKPVPRLNHVDEVTDWASVLSVQSNFWGWLKESAARLEFRVFRRTPIEVRQDLSPQELLSLPLLCLAGTTQESLSLNRVKPEVVFRFLFHAFAAGCAYYTGDQGAVGRLRTWQTLGAILGDSQLHVTNIELHARKVKWYFVDVVSDWYYRESPFNIGIVAVDEATGRTAILAVTDTD